MTRSLLIWAIFFLATCDHLDTMRMVSGEKILFLLPMASKSHKNVFQPLITGMAERGHEVTVVSPFKPSKEQKGIREMVPNNFAEGIQAFGEDPFQKRQDGKLAFLTMNFTFMFDACEDTYQNPEFMDLLNEPFDLMYVNAFMNDCMFGFVHIMGTKWGTPFIVVSTIAAPTQITGHAGNRLPSSFVPTAMFDFPDAMTFPQRMGNFAFNLLSDVFALSYIAKYEAIYRKYMGQDLPDWSVISSNVSAIMMNSHFTLTYPRPTLPDVIEVGGMHCRPAKPLPKDIEDFVADAKDGFIYFSLGSIVQANTMPEHVRQIFLNVFSRLKQRVLWKWEIDGKSDIPKNVKLLKWAPQQDILGHKNLRLFITHGGLLSTQEAAYHGVPLLGLPIFGDQDLNMKKAERTGYALAVEILEITEETLETAINRLLNEKQFSERAKEISTIYRDQPETPLQRAIFWSEYVIRHKGARHMRSAARNLNFFQYHSLDVIAALTITVGTILWILKMIVVLIFRKTCCRGSNKKNKKKRL